jgi:anti-sigma factor RsiW
MSDSSLSPDMISWELLDRYCAGEGSQDEQRYVRSYLVSHPAQKTVVAALAKALRRSQEQLTPDDTATLLVAARARLARRVSLRTRLHDQASDRLGHAVAALLDVRTDALSAEEVEELQRMIDAAKREGR